VSPTDGLDILEKRKNSLPLLQTELQIIHPIAWSLYQLSYIGYIAM
jgi:hypothetical protein